LEVWHEPHPFDANTALPDWLPALPVPFVCPPVPPVEDVDDVDAGAVCVGTEPITVSGFGDTTLALPQPARKTAARAAIAARKTVGRIGRASLPLRLD
jgi:hypothetical protein